jgi:hypothetical protein
MQKNNAVPTATPLRLIIATCLAGALISSTAVAQDKPAPAKKKPTAVAPAPACDINSFNRSANGQTFWAATGQYTQNPLVGQMNCLLDQFAMNNFLYLVGNDANGKPRFMSYAPWYNLFTPAGTTPTWTGTYAPLSTVELNRHKNQQQAGDGFVLMDVNTQATAYDVRVNQTFFNYVAQNSYYKQSNFNAAVAAFNANSATGGIYFPPTSPSDTSEGAVEIKTAWRNYGPMQKKYISQKVSIDLVPCPEDAMHCERDAKGNFWGLTGFHLVQKTPDQPGFVWATFEHMGNAPDCASGSSTPISQFPISPATGQPMNLNARLLNSKIRTQTGWNYFNYTGYKQGGGDGSKCTFPNNLQSGTQCLGNPQGAGKTWLPVNICRTLSLPKPTAANCAGSIIDGNNLKAPSCLNESVKRNFKSTGLANKWMNYRLVGMEWLLSGATGFGQFTPACLTYDETGKNACPNYKPNPPSGAEVAKVGDGPGGAPNYGRAGSGVGNVVSPANTTMETWMQYNVKLSSQTGQTDCFACHQPATAGGTGGFGQGDFSHLFGRIQQP